VWAHLGCALVQVGELVADRAEEVAHRVELVLLAPRFRQVLHRERDIERERERERERVCV